MNRRIFFSQRQGVAGVIEALLLVALVAVIISTIQLVYIPEIMEQREAEHMDTVENQFSFLKSVIDIQTTMGEDVPVSSPITLGSKELPYFVTARAFGQLDIIDQTQSQIDTDSFVDQVLTSIQLDAMNSYYIDQDLILEGGGLIIKQADGETMRIHPSITWETQAGTIAIQWILPEFNSIAGKNSTGGFKNCYIRTNYSSTEIKPTATNYIYIYTDFLDAWNNSLQVIFNEAIEDNDVSILKYPVDSPEYIKIEGNGKSISVEITVVTIGAQIGPGTVLQ
ncbi:MAG: hypothetical protein R6U21_05360 [Thermoplasmatota archaeon]